MLEKNGTGCIPFQLIMLFCFLYHTLFAVKADAILLDYCVPFVTKTPFIVLLLNLLQSLFALFLHLIKALRSLQFQNDGSAVSYPSGF